ncbi:MAG: hypothetical protein ACXW3Z_07900, partial [Limisphaerales bacterium]
MVGFREALILVPTLLCPPYCKTSNAIELDGTLQLPGFFAASKSGATTDDATPAKYSFSRSAGD